MPASPRAVSREHRRRAVMATAATAAPALRERARDDVGRGVRARAPRGRRRRPSRGPGRLRGRASASPTSARSSPRRPRRHRWLTASPVDARRIRGRSAPGGASAGAFATSPSRSVANPGPMAPPRNAPSARRHRPLLPCRRRRRRRRLRLLRCAASAATRRSAPGFGGGAYGCRTGSSRSTPHQITSRPARRSADAKLRAASSTTEMRWTGLGTRIESREVLDAGGKPASLTSGEPPPSRARRSRFASCRC